MAPLYFLLNASHTRALSPSIPHLASNRTSIISYDSNLVIWSIIENRPDTLHQNVE